MPLKTTKFDAAEHLDTPESQAAFISAAFETGDTAYITSALGVIARARGMSSIAKEAGISRKGLYKALSDKGDPKLSTLLGVFKALGMQLTSETARG